MRFLARRRVIAPRPGAPGHGSPGQAPEGPCAARRSRHAGRPGAVVDPNEGSGGAVTVTGGGAAGSMIDRERDSISTTSTHQYVRVVLVKRGSSSTGL